MDQRTERLAALRARAEAAATRPGISPAKLAAAQRVLKGVDLLLSARQQESKPSSSAWPEEERQVENSTHPLQPLPKLSEEEFVEAVRLGTEYALESVDHNLAMRKQRIMAEAKSVQRAATENEAGSGATADQLKPANQQNEVPLNAEPRWSAARWWTIAGAGGLSVIPILAGPIWQHGDPEAQLGLLIYGPLIVAFLVSCVFIFVDTISSEKDRAEWLSDFAANPLKSIMGLTFLFVTMAFFGLLVLGGMGFIPDLGIWYPILIATSMLILVVGRFL